MCVYKYLAMGNGGEWLVTAIRNDGVINRIRVSPTLSVFQRMSLSPTALEHLMNLRGEREREREREERERGRERGMEGERGERERTENGEERKWREERKERRYRRGR